MAQYSDEARRLERRLRQESQLSSSRGAGLVQPASLSSGNLHSVRAFFDTVKAWQQTMLLLLIHLHLRASSHRSNCPLSARICPFVALLSKYRGDDSERVLFMIQYNIGHIMYRRGSLFTHSTVLLVDRHGLNMISQLYTDILL